jgi:DNA topoisomerase-2
MKNKSASETYQKIDHLEHILKRPGMYIGDVTPIKQDMWIYDEKDKCLNKKNLKFVPGFYKIVDEVITNASDHSQNDNTCNEIKIDVDEESISVYNNGDKGIPVEIHKKEKIYIPEMIFGHLLTSSNYDDSKKRTTGGLNGLGAKLANIYSTKFVIEVGDKKNKKKYYQEFSSNMGDKTEPIITPYTNKSYTKITFYPEFSRFKLKDIDKHHQALFKKRAFDLAATTNDKVKIFFNDEKINIKDFKTYMDLYHDEIDKKDKIYENINDRWQIGCMYVPDSGENISYVNGISTYNGGTHVNYVSDDIVTRLINNHIKKKDKDLKVSPNLVKEHVVFFVNSIIENPSFANQVKDTLTTKKQDFGSEAKVSDGFIKKLAATDLVKKVMEFAKFKENSSLKKTDGKQTSKIKGIPKLEDAAKAGTKSGSSKCSLILTEGDSAKALALSGIGKMREYYGVFPLRGKLLNVREATAKQLQENEEIKALKIILGLQQSKDYTSDEAYSGLRYGRVIIFTDQDVDGSHIKGLIMNFFGWFWPSLLKKEGFLTCLTTPVVKVSKGKDKVDFYNLTDFENWKDNNNDGKNWQTKYYKGLGTSTRIEGQEYFQDVEDKLVFYHDTDSDKDILSMAFDKKKADDRKVWLMNYNKEEIINNDDKHTSYEDFINRELIHFSNYDCSRSIPSVIDGFKPSHRKILFGGFHAHLDDQKKEMKIAQLAGRVAEVSEYHHGEQNLPGTIIGMAQTFVGSNNINLFEPLGQFGTRLQGGKDFASPRYIFTRFGPLTDLIFNKLDYPVLNQQVEDHHEIEPQYYCPIIPMVLINGAHGIGTGFSTTIPPYKPKDIIMNIRRLLDEKKPKDIHPWWARFKGKVAKKQKNEYILQSIYDIKDNKLIITELPVGVWTQNYKEFLEAQLMSKKKEKIIFTGYTENNNDLDVYFELSFNREIEDSDVEDLEKRFNLNKSYKISNIHLYDPNNIIKKYEDVNSVLEDYYETRLETYELRKVYMLKKYKYDLELISYKVKFLMMVINEKLKVNNVPKKKLEEDLEKHKFVKMSSNIDSNNKSYDYLTGMPIFNLTKEKIDSLKNDEDQKEALYNILKDKSPKDLWSEELDVLEQAYNKWWEKEQAQDKICLTDTKASKTSKTKKTKKK